MLLLGRRFPRDQKVTVLELCPVLVDRQNQGEVGVGWSRGGLGSGGATFRRLPLTEVCRGRGVSLLILGPGVDQTAASGLENSSDLLYHTSST